MLNNNSAKASLCLHHVGSQGSQETLPDECGGSRNRLSEEVICALLRDFQQHGQKAIAKVRRDQPGVYLKVLALLIPREHKVEQSNVIKNLSDQQIEDMIEYIENSLAAQAGVPVIRLRRSPTLEIARSAPIIDIDLALKYGSLAP